MNASEYSIALAQLAQSFERYGIDEKVSDVIASGVVLRLLHWCWANLTDTVGDGPALEKIAAAPLPPGVLPRLLYKHGLIGMTKGVFYVPLAYADRPTRVDRQWRREDKPGYDAAMRRAKLKAQRSSVEAHQPPSTDDAAEPPMFGELKEPEDAVEAKPKKKPRRTDSGTIGHKELVTYWCDRWKDTEGRGHAYPFGGVDAKCIKTILERTAGIDQAKAVVEAYLRCTDAFYTGKTLKRLVYDLPRFVAAAAKVGRPPASEAGDIPGYDDDPLPNLTS